MGRRIKRTPRCAVAAARPTDPRLARLPSILAERGESVPPGLAPLVTIAYRRRRFVLPRLGARVCIDSDIRATAAHPRLGVATGRALPSAVVEVKAGSSQGGNAVNEGSHHPERSGAVRSYKPTAHRHLGEIQQELGADNIHFSATSIEMVRGILATCHVFLNQDLQEKDIWKLYRAAYGDEPFIRIVKERSGIHRYPEPKILAGSNYCDIGFERDPHSNRLVVIAPSRESSPLDLEQPEAFVARLTKGPLAMALVEAVPAGIYGKEALETLDLWPAVAGRVAQTDNVRAGLALVSSGEAPLGIVYASDVRADPDVAVVADIPAAAHAPVIYPAAVVVGGNLGTATDFLRYLQSPEAQAVFAAQGFLPAGG